MIYFFKKKYVCMQRIESFVYKAQFGILHFIMSWDTRVMTIFFFCNISSRSLLLWSNSIFVFCACLKFSWDYTVQSPTHCTAAIFDICLSWNNWNSVYVTFVSRVSKGSMFFLKNLGKPPPSAAFQSPFESGRSPVTINAYRAYRVSEYLFSWICT